MTGYFSSVTEDPGYQTNIGVFPITPYPATEWSTIMRNLNKRRTWRRRTDHDIT